MQQVRVADDQMYPDGGTEARHTGACEGLPQATRGSPEQRARCNDATAREEATPEARAIMCDERHEARVGGVEVGNRQAHELEILRHEDARHADRENCGSGQEHTKASDQQSEMTESLATAESARNQVGVMRRGVPHEGARAEKACREDRDQKGGAYAVPRVEIPMAEIGKEAEKTSRAADGDGPPRLRGPLTEWHRRQPEVQDRDGNEDAAKGNPIVKHEGNNAAICHGTKLLRRHP